MSLLTSNKMSEAAIKNDESLGVPLIPIKKIYMDHEFNCRGFFSPTECIELAKDIAQRGLQQPISIRHLREEDKGDLKNEGDLLDQGYEYVVVAGYRRLYSYKINEAESIPAILKETYMSDFDAHDLNAIENIHRQELNLYQEARAIQHYKKAGWTLQETSDKVGKSLFWVRARFKLLEMPDEVQQAAAQGWVKSSDIKELEKIKDTTELLKTVGIIRGKRKRGENRNVFKDVKLKKDKDSKKHRKREEIFEMIEHIADTFKHRRNNKLVNIEDIINDQGFSLMTRLLSWSAGEISTNELEGSIKKLCKVLDIYYEGGF